MIKDIKYIHLHALKHLHDVMQMYIYTILV
jgi:hypothetical protein